ncbi:MAG: GAF domain-containing protein, partial [Anaerolineales bacterium]
MTHPANDGHRYPYLSYLGVPLLIAGELIGTIELASLSKEKFRATDLEVLRLLAGQAAIALNNALLYKQELERSLELGGLASLAKAVSAIRDPQDLYSRLIDSISPLLDVDILGFLVFDENRGMLVGQVPFMGIQSTVIEWYQVKIQPDTPAEEIWKSAETLIATNAPEDPQLVTLGLHHLALAAGVRHTVLEPLTSGGEMLGYLQVANKRDGTPFDQNDMRFLKIVAGQTAPIIENAKLAQQSQHRMQRAETLRRIASLTSSAATLDEILKFSILDLARLLHADIAILFLVDENHGDLKPHKSSAFGVPPEAFDGLGYLSTEDPLFNRSVTGSHQELFSGDIRQDPDILPIYQQLADELEIRSFMDVPLIIRDRGIGELVIGSTRPDVYSHGDAQTAGTSAWQLATAIERETLYSQTDQNLRQRVEQLTALTRVSRELNATLELQHLLQRVYDEVLRTTRADCGTILLFDVDAVWSGQVLEKEAVVDDHLDARILLHIGDLPGRGFHPLERMVLEGGKAVSIDDFNKVKEAGDGNGGSPDQPLHPAHSGVLSALVIPIAYQGQVAGIIHLHAKTANHFGEAEREIGEALAIQAAIALGNAHRYREQVKRGELLN